MARQNIEETAKFSNWRGYACDKIAAHPSANPEKQNSEVRTVKSQTIQSEFSNLLLFKNLKRNLMT